jgi:hypothetical protein
VRKKQSYAWHFFEKTGRHSRNLKLCGEVAGSSLFFSLVITLSKKEKKIELIGHDCGNFLNHKSNQQYSSFTFLYTWMSNQLNNLATIRLFFWVFWSTLKKSDVLLPRLTACNFVTYLQKLRFFLWMLLKIRVNAHLLVGVNLMD